MDLVKILIVEDDLRLGDTLKELLKDKGYDPELVDNGRDGYDYAVSGYYDVIILDVMLPGMNGYEIVKKIRQEKINTPVLMLTAKDEWSDKVKGLDSGADDYLTKPFNSEELFARIRALSRRTGEVILEEITFNDLTLNLSMEQLDCNGKSIRLPSKEMEIMRILMANKGRIIPKDELITQVWSAEADVEDNNVEVYISFLRKKLNFLKTNVEISTARKVGYFLK